MGFSSGPGVVGSGCGLGEERYFSVMWCKASKKKHKRWEGDAVLVTRGRSATLKDMEGKDFGKGVTPLLSDSSHSSRETFSFSFVCVCVCV